MVYFNSNRVHVKHTSLMSLLYLEEKDLESHYSISLWYDMFVCKHQPLCQYVLHQRTPGGQTSWWGSIWSSVRWINQQMLCGAVCFPNIIILSPLVSWPEQEIVWQNSKNPGLHALWFISACLSVFCGLLLPISQVFLSCQLVRIENFSPLLKTHITTTNPSFYNSNNFVHS